LCFSMRLSMSNGSSITFPPGPSPIRKMVEKDLARLKRLPATLSRDRQQQFCRQCLQNSIHARRHCSAAAHAVTQQNRRFRPKELNMPKSNAAK
jgi:hypothetical protein